MLRPELFEIIEAAHFRPEEMDDNIDRIDQHPVALVHAFNPDMTVPRFLEFFDELVGNGADMAVGPRQRTGGSAWPPRSCAA